MFVRFVHVELEALYSLPWPTRRLPLDSFGSLRLVSGKALCYITADRKLVTKCRLTRRNLMATTAAVWPVAGHQDSSAAPTGPFSVPQSLVDHSPLPKGFPAALDTGLAWTGNSFRDTSDYVLRLTEEDAGEIESALRQFHSKTVSRVNHKSGS